MNQVTAHSIYKALRETEANGMTEKAIAIAASIDTTSENLRMIKEELVDSNHPYIIKGDIKLWCAL